MKKIIIFFLVILFYPQISFGEEETYLSQVDNCEKKNKKMGELAWKQCVDKIHYSSDYKTFSGSANFIYEKDKPGELNLLEILPKDMLPNNLTAKNNYGITLKYLGEICKAEKTCIYQYFYTHIF